MGTYIGGYQIWLVLKRIYTIKCGVYVPSLVDITRQEIEMGSKKLF